MEKHVAVRTDGKRLSKAARARVFINTCRLEDIPVPSHQIREEDIVEMGHLVRARDVEEGRLLPFVLENQDLLAYGCLGAKCLDARMLGV